MVSKQRKMPNIFCAVCLTCLGDIRHSVLSMQNIIPLLMVILLSVSISYVVMPKRISIVCISLIEHSRAGFEESHSISGMGMAEKTRYQEEHGSCSSSQQVDCSRSKRRAN